MCVLVHVRCCSNRYTVTLGKPPYRCLAILACNGSIANRYTAHRKTPYGRLIGAVTVRNGNRYAELVDNQMNPRVVMSVGGWDSFQAIEPYLNSPSEDVVNSSFEEANL